MKHFNVMVIKLNSPSQIFCIQNNVFLEMACFKCHSLKISILEIFPENFTQNLFRSQHVGQDPSEIHQNDWLISNTFKETREKCYMHWRAQKKIKFCYRPLRWEVVKTLGSGQPENHVNRPGQWLKEKYFQENIWKVIIQEIKGRNNPVCIVNHAWWRTLVCFEHFKQLLFGLACFSWLFFFFLVDLFIVLLWHFR